MSIATATARYAAAALVAPTAPSPGVEVHELEWPAMRQAVSAIRDLRRRRDEGVSAALEDIIDDAAAWARRLAAAPISPAAPAAGTETLATAVAQHLATNLEPRCTPSLAALAQALADLGRHPAAQCLENVISLYGRSTADAPPAAYVASGPHEADAVRAWLEDEELDAEVLPVTMLREADVRDALVLLGPPSRYLASPWCPPQQAARRGGWLLTAPPARHVHIVTWPGHPRFDIDAVNAFPNSPAPSIATHRAADTASEPAVWLPPAPVEARVIPKREWLQDRDPVEARAVILADASVALFSPREDPRPEVVTWDGGSVEVMNMDVRRLRPGSVLLFRPLRSAIDEELHRRADETLAARHGVDAPAKAAAACQELKRAFDATSLTHEQLVYELKCRLNDEGYARHIVHCLGLPNYIAPEKPGAYKVVRRVLRLGECNGSEEAILRALRGARRHAGIEITRDLIDILRSTDGWQPALEGNGVASVGAGERFGTLELRVVAALDPTQTRVGRSRLGRLTERR